MTSSAWPPRRLPTRTRLVRIRFSRLNSDVLTPLAVRLALWTGWSAATAAAFLVIDHYV